MSGYILRHRLSNPSATYKPQPVRLVHADRARKLRRRGVRVVFVGYTINGKAAYEWTPKPKASSLELKAFDMLARLEAWHFK